VQLAQEKRIIMKTNFYAVTAVCGHVGSGHYLLKTFAINADSGKEASTIARYLPRVKHDYKLAIVSCQRITLSDYKFLYSKNQNDSYLQCHNIQDQKRQFPNYKEERLSMNNKEPLDDDSVTETKKRAIFKHRKEKEIITSFQTNNWDDDSY
jgi:hypothetical protein